MTKAEVTEILKKRYRVLDDGLKGDSEKTEDSATWRYLITEDSAIDLRFDRFGKLVYLNFYLHKLDYFREEGEKE